MVRACRRAVHDQAASQNHEIILDLHAASLDDSSVAVLGLLRRSARRQGAVLSLADAPDQFLQVLQRHRVATAFRFHRSVAVAVATVVDEYWQARDRIGGQDGQCRRRSDARHLSRMPR